VHTMVTKFTSKQHENYIPNRNMCTQIYLFTKVINPCSKGGAILTSKNKVGGVNE
jgi:hypothetical protein